MLATQSLKNRKENINLTNTFLLGSLDAFCHTDTIYVKRYVGTQLTATQIYKLLLLKESIIFWLLSIVYLFSCNLYLLLV